MKIWKKSPTLLIVEQEKKSIRKGYNHTPQRSNRDTLGCDLIKLYCTVKLMIKFHSNTSGDHPFC